MRGNPSRKDATHTITSITTRFFFKAGCSSMKAVMMVSMVQKVVPRPMVTSIRKKRMDHSDGTGNDSSAAGYTINVMPTSEITNRVHGERHAHI